MRVLMISRDPNILTPGSRSYERHEAYRTLVDELRVVTFGRWFLKTERMRCCRYDLVVAQDPFETGLLGVVLARIFGARLQIQIHTDFLNPLLQEESFLYRIRTRIARFVIPRANCVRVVSRRIKEGLISSGLVKGTCIDLIPIYADIPHGAQSSTMTFPFMPVVLMVSRLTREKNIPLALRAFSRVLAHYPGAGLVIAGDGPLRGELEATIRALGIAKNVLFAGWVSDLAPYYAAADLFLSVSDYEGYGMTLVEAAGAGCPIVTTDVGLVGDLLGPTEAGIVPPRDEEVLVARILETLSDEKLRVKQCDSARARISALPSWDEYLDSYRDSWNRCGRS